MYKTGTGFYISSEYPTYYATYGFQNKPVHKVQGYMVRPLNSSAVQTRPFIGKRDCMQVCHGHFVFITVNFFLKVTVVT
jgi:hypothetical protein